jgi:predicted RNA-binding Zn-ribbon protein involved in translation (DUF1610 family)
MPSKQFRPIMSSENKLQRFLRTIRESFGRPLPKVVIKLPAKPVIAEMLGGPSTVTPSTGQKVGVRLTGTTELPASGGSLSSRLPTSKLSRKEKEVYVSTNLSCPNCGATQFDETCCNAAITLRCDCGLTFNFMPLLRDVQIVRDPFSQP